MQRQWEQVGVATVRHQTGWLRYSVGMLDQHYWLPVPYRFIPLCSRQGAVAVSLATSNASAMCAAPVVAAMGVVIVPEGQQGGLAHWLTSMRSRRGPATSVALKQLEGEGCGL